MRFKILRIIARLNIGGPARNAVLLTEGLSDKIQYPKSEIRNYKTVLVCGEVAKGEGDMTYLAREKGIEPVIVPELGRELSIINDWKAFWKIYRIICKEKPDIIHTHTAKAGTLGRLAGILYKVTHCWCRVKGEGCRLVHTFHGHVLHSYFDKAKTLFFIWIEKILALFTDRIITVSGSLKKELVERFRIAPERKFSVVELGFELDDLLKLPERNNSDYVNVGIVGRLVPIKNHRMLFKAVKKVKDKGSRVKIRVIGDGELRQELEDYARELGIEDIVEFKGWVKDLREIYEGLDIVALTSSNEGTPVSIIEAMAAARPVVATNVGGVSDIVQDGTSGYLINSNDGNIFSERLLTLIKDHGKRKQFGRSGRETIGMRFLKQKLIEETQRLYSDLLRKNV